MARPEWCRKATTHAEYATLGGFEGAEVIMWLVMRGALSANIRKLHQSYCLPSMTSWPHADDGCDVMMATE